jgi:hypothetical protein
MALHYEWKAVTWQEAAFFGQLSIGWGGREFSQASAPFKV